MTDANPNGSSPSPTHVIGQRIGEVTQDVTTIAELQWKLLTLDWKESTHTLVFPLAIAVAGSLLLAACFPIALAAAALALAEVAGIPRALALLSAAGAGLVGSVLLLALAWSGMRRCLAVFGRSQEELKQNISWIKRMLRSLGKMPNQQT